MSFLKGKNHWHTILYSRITLGVLLVLCMLLAVSVYERYKAEREMHERRIVAEEELEELQQRKDELETKVDYLSGERGVEEEIRKHFDVAREGEQVVILIGDDTPPQDEFDTLLGDTTEEDSFWTKLFSW